MSVSKKRSPARWLRLERLESRSLLAAGVFDFVGGGIARDQGTSETPNQVDQSTQRQNAGVESTDIERRDPNQGRIEKTLASDQRDLRVEPQTRGQQLRGTGRQRFSRQGDRALESGSLERPLAIAAAPLGDSLAPLDGGNLPPLRPNQQPFAQLLPIVARAGASVETTTTPLAASDQVDAVFASLPSAIPSREAPVGDALSVATAQNAATNADTSVLAVQFTESDSSQLIQSELLRSTADVVVTPSQEFSGLVDLTPLGQWQSLDDADELPSEPWQLDSSTLLDLHQAIENTSADVFELDDAVVDQWFGDPGGMVAIDQFALPQSIFGFDPVIVEVQVESTVMLYRSLDLFAVSDMASTSGQLSAPVLDTIMTTLGEVADSEFQPVGDPPRVRLSALTYPVAVIAATGVALSARQKSKPRSSIDHHGRPL